MARLVGPDEGSRLGYGIRPDNAITTAGGLVATVWADSGGTVLADILTLAGAAITGSRLTLGADSLIPLFQFPDGVKVVYTSVNGGPVVPIYARATDQVSAAQAAAATDATGKVATHAADTTDVHGIPDTAVLETTSGAQDKADAAQAAAIEVSAQRASNLSDLASATTARTNLGLGGAATLAVGTAAGTVAAGDDSRITGAVQSSVVDAKGDLVVGSGNDAVTRLPVGADRRVPAADSSQPAGMRWTDPLGLEFVTTSIQGSLGTGSNAWPVANDARYARVLGSGTISKIGLEVTAQSGNISVAVYSKTGSGINAQPGARVATSGAITCPPVGYVEISLGGSVSVSDGDYLALSCDNAVAAFRGVSGSVNRLAAVISFAQTAAHPLPSAATPVASASRIPLLIGIP